MVIFDLPVGANGWIYKAVSNRDPSVVNITSCSVAQLNGLEPVLEEKEEEEEEEKKLPKKQKWLQQKCQ